MSYLTWPVDLSILNQKGMKKLYHLFSKSWRWSLLVSGLLLTMCLTGQPVTAQTPVGKPVSISFKDESLSTILQFIAKQSGLQISVVPEVAAYEKTYTISLDQATAEQAVKTLLAESPFAYTVSGRTIRIFPLKASQKTDQYLVTGVVKDNKGETIPSATVRVSAENKGQLTDLDGNFSFKVSKPKGEVTISCVGFKNVTLPYESGKPLTVVLHEDVTTLGEVTVIAYGTRNTRELTGAVSSVKAEKLQDLPNPSIETLLQGQMPGVEVTNVSGTPGGGGSQLVIRGYSSLNSQGVNDGTPLYVIDGVPVYSTTSDKTGGINTLAGLDPSTIESVEVLKDAASASLYGSRAANGVILITTKKGKSGRPQFSVNVSQSFSWLPETPTQMSGHAERLFHLALAKSQRKAEYDWMTNNLVMPKDFADSYGWDPMYSGAYDYLWRNGARLDESTRIQPIAVDSLNTFYNNSTNWWDYIFRTGYVTDADVMASGGTDNVRYMVGGSFYDETGIMIGSSFRRFSLVNNLDINLFPKLEFYSRLSLSYSSKNAGSDMGKVQGLTADPKATSTLLPGRGTEIERLTLQRLRDIVQENSNYNLRLNLGFRYNILKSLTLNSSAALNHYGTRVHIFTPDYLTWDKHSKVDSRRVGLTMLQTEHILNYTTSFANGHELDLMGGVTYTYDFLNNVGGSGKGGPTNQIHHVSQGWPTIKTDEFGTPQAMQSFTTDFQEQAMLSFLGRVNYNYEKKYMVDLSLRRDGSSVFGSSVRWGNFPAAGVAWAFSEESFAKDWWWLSFGKLRASWGRSGQKFQEAYLAHGVMTESNVFFGEAGLIPGMSANNKLTWEKSDQYNFGLDLDLLDYRLKVGLDYYYKYSYALLLQTPTPGDVYFVDKMWNNASAVSNEGLELSLKADIIRTKEFDWEMMFNISRNWNLFRESYDGVDFNEMVLGRPMNGIYVYQDEGIVQSEAEIPYYYKSDGAKRPLLLGGENHPLRVGGRKIKDQNGDGQINDQDLYYAGTTIPSAYGGLSNQFKWKGFTLFLHANFTLGRKVLNMVKGSAFSFTKDFGTIMDDYNKYTFWKKPGDQADYPSLEFADTGYAGQFDGLIDSNIENISFFRLKQATLSYDLPKEWVEKINVKGLRVYLSGENLFMLTNYSGLDPEIIDPYSGKDDGTYYPLSRKITVGLNLNF